MTIDTKTALEARDTWLKISRAIPILEAALQPARTGETKTRTPPTSRAPLTWWISDLLEEIDTATDFYISCLLMETHDVRRAPATLTERIQLIAHRYGHWTADTDTRLARVKGPDHKWLRDENGHLIREPRPLGRDYCDEAQGFWDRIERILRQPMPPKFMGPCLTNCGGDLWLQPGRLAATCDQCKSEADLGSVKDQLTRALESRLMRQAEIAPALRIVGAKVATGTIKSWVHRGRLVPVVTIAQTDMYRFADAVELAGVAV